MTYTPFNPDTIHFLPTQIIITVVLWFITYKIARKVQEKRQKEENTDLAVQLRNTFIVMALTITLVASGFLSAVILGEFREYYRFSLPAGYALLIVANLLFYYFSLNLYELNKNRLIIVGFAFLVVLILVLLPCNYYGVPSELYDPGTSCRFISNVALVGASFIVYSDIAWRAFRIAKRAKERLPTTSFTLIGLSACFLILFLIMLTIDALLIDMGSDGYTAFLHVGYLSIIGFAVSSYAGLLMPPWIRKYLVEVR